MSKSCLHDKVYGCLTAGALGDAMGAPVEWWTPEKIAAEHGWLNRLIGGRFTDDTYLKNLLCQCYIRHRKHLTADEWGQMWVQEVDENRIWWAEKYGWYKVKIAREDPRLAGIGNIVNCGAAMYIPPVGLVNACNPEAAYREALDIARVNQWSFGLEAAGVLAAGVAAAMIPQATPESVVEIALDLAKGGTKGALAALYQVAKGCSDLPSALSPLRSEMAKFDTQDDSLNRLRPNKNKSIEEVPVAFALFFIAKGEVMPSIEAGVNYGRDCDSIAGMAGALAGALKGREGLPEAMVRQLEEAIDYDAQALATQMTEVCLATSERDARCLEALKSLAKE